MRTLRKTGCEDGIFRKSLLKYNRNDLTPAIAGVLIIYSSEYDTGGRLNEKIEIYSITDV